MKVRYLVTVRLVTGKEHVGFRDFESTYGRPEHQDIEAKGYFRALAEKKLRGIQFVLIERVKELAGQRPMGQDHPKAR